MIALFAPIALVAQADPQWLEDARGEYARFADELQVEPSATLLLARWCGARGYAFSAIRAVVDRDVVKPPSPEQRARLQVSADEPIAYRSVRLMCGSHTMSEAENWYVPGRLSPEILAQLKSDVPFGAAIILLRPHRVAIGGPVRLWNGRLPVPEAILRQQALVVDREGRPLAEVSETYQRDLITARR